MPPAPGERDYFHRRVGDGDAEQGSTTTARSESGIRKRFSALYGELREIAERVLLRRGDARAVTPHDLLHEAFVKLRQEHERRREEGLTAIGHKPEEVFKSCVGAACRDVLVDWLRRDGAQKRGGEDVHVEIHSGIEVPGSGTQDILSLHDTLADLETVDPDLAELVEARVFGMLNHEECAALLGVSTRTIARRWMVATAWLRQRLR
ncbi:MAG: ECF-type sigma factor [Planctomycetota bacterium]